MPPACRNLPLFLPRCILSSLQRMLLLVEVQLVIYNAHIAWLGASEAEDVGRTIRVRVQCLTPIFTEPCRDRLLSTACWAASASVSLQTNTNNLFLLLFLRNSRQLFGICRYIVVLSTHFKKTKKYWSQRKNTKTNRVYYVVKLFSFYFKSYIMLSRVIIAAVLPPTGHIW